MKLEMKLLKATMLASARLDAQGQSCPTHMKDSQCGEVSQHAIEIDGVIGQQGQTIPNLEQFDSDDELAKAETLDPDKCFENGNVPANEISGDHSSNM